MRTILVLLIASFLTIPGAAVALVPATTEPYHVEAASGAAGAGLCNDRFCVRADVTTRVVECVETTLGHSCTVFYSLTVVSQGTGSGCVQASTEPTGSLTGCKILPGSAYYGARTGEKTYHGLAPDASIQEQGVVCVDPLVTGLTRCKEFTVTTRLPGQQAIGAGRTAPTADEPSFVNLALCTEGAVTAGQGCVDLRVTATLDGCEGMGIERTCTIQYDLEKIVAGVDLCASVEFTDHLVATCSEGNVLLTLTGWSKTYDHEAIANGVIHEEGTLCTDAHLERGRCVAFDVRVPVE